MEALNLPTYFFRIKEEQGKKYIFDELRRRFVLLTPEEWVRQHIIQFLIKSKNFPKQLMSIEKGFTINRRLQRFDLLVYDRNNGHPLMIVECKAPGVEINQHVFDQAGRYNNMYKASFILVTNGLKHYCCRISIRDNTFSFLPDIPDYASLVYKVSSC